MIYDSVKPLHLLLTDDDEDKRLLLNRALTRKFPHASIFECHSGQEALEYVHQNSVDAIVTDHSMYPVNGIELVKVLRGEGNRVPIIMVSAHSQIRAEAEAAGVDLFLSTPHWDSIGEPIAEFLHGKGIFDRIES